MASEEHKKRAALAALQYLDNGMTLGVGTGSTVRHFIDALPAHAEKLRAIVSSSEQSTQQLAEVGLEVTTLAQAGPIDLYVDGADESTKHRQLIKGGGGALTREKILAAAAREFVCIVDSSKMVPVLGKFPLPIEVIPMARSYVARQVVAYGGKPVWREGFITDNGNEILDVHNLVITDPSALETELNQMAGIVTVGLFARRGADVLLVADGENVRTL